MQVQTSCTRPLIIAIIIGCLLIALGLAIGLGLGLSSHSDSGTKKSSETTTYRSGTDIYTYATVVADSLIASDIGNDILARKRGNAVDAAVAALLVTGVMSSHSTGIGGGSFYVIYDSSQQKWHSVDSRETAPSSATQDMYTLPENKNKSTIGGLAVAVPGEVKGLYEIHQRFGKVPWREVVRPVINLCQSGVPLTMAVHSALAVLTTQQEKGDFSEYFDTNQKVLPVGTKIVLNKLAHTLQQIADDPMSFYNGSLAEDIVDDINDKGGNMTLDDLRNYTVKWSVPTNMSLPGGLRVYSIPPPGSGLVLSYILGILSGYKFSNSSLDTEDNSILAYHRIVEAMKFAYGKRTELGDDNFVNVTADSKKMLSLEFAEETRNKINDSATQDTNYYNPSFSIKQDQGTAHISIIDSEGNAVSVTSTINTYFGSRVKGERTGIVFNNEMDDFSTPNTSNSFQLPASEANFIHPGKRPMSSMCPAIVWDDKTQKIKMVVGAAGGSKITTATALNIIDTLWFGMSLPASVDQPRLHHQLTPKELQMESDFPQGIRTGLQAKGHKISAMQGISVVQAALILDNGDIVAVADWRKGGHPAGY